MMRNCVSLFLYSCYFAVLNLKKQNVEYFPGPANGVHTKNIAYFYASLVILLLHGIFFFCIILGADYLQ